VARTLLTWRHDVKRHSHALEEFTVWSAEGYIVFQYAGLVL
jgi:hypothetical protein